MDQAHPLERKWTLRYDCRIHSKKETKQWIDTLSVINTISTVEEFWNTFNHIKPPSSVAVSSTYHLFEESVMPMWEDEKNKKGGKWQFILPKADDPDELWLRAVLGIVGETMDDEAPLPKQIRGIVFKKRKACSTIEIWTGDGANLDAVRRIGMNFQTALRGAEKGPTVKIEYCLLADADKKGPGMACPIVMKLPDPVATSPTAGR